MAQGSAIAESEYLRVEQARQATASSRRQLGESKLQDPKPRVFQGEPHV